jgi:hypothetical protein
MESPYISPENKYQESTIEELTAATNNPDVYEHYLLDSSILTYGGAYDSVENKWQYGFDVQAHGTCRRYYKDESPKQGWKKDHIHEHYLRIYDDSPGGEIWTTGDHDKIGGSPAPKTTAIEVGSDIVETLAADVLTDASDIVNNLAMASEVYNDLEAFGDDPVTNGDDKKYTWHYSEPDGFGDKHSDIMHHSHFNYLIPNGTTQTIHVEHDLQRQPELFNDTVTITWDIEVGAPNPDTLSSTSEQSARLLNRNDRGTSTVADQSEIPAGPVRAGPENLSKREKNKYGIELKKKRVMQKAGFNPSEEDIVEGDLVWHMSNPPIQFIPGDSNSMTRQREM